MSGLYSDLDIDYNPLITVVLANLLGFVLVVTNFSYFYYLTRSEKRGEAVRNALLFSILIAGVPLLLFPVIVAFSIFSLISPIYNIESAF